MQPHHNHIAVHWFRRDLRLHDNTALYQALAHHDHVLPIFIFDTNILKQLTDKNDRRLVFIARSLEKIKQELEKNGSSLLVIHDTPLKAFEYLVQNYNIQAVYTNTDYEPYATQRDNEIKRFLNDRKIAFHTLKDQVVFEKNEVLKNDGSPYTIYTPYMNKWKSLVKPENFAHQPSEQLLKKCIAVQPFQSVSLPDIGFNDMPHETFALPDVSDDLIKNYHLTRDFPAVQGTSRLSVHLRFGTISTRQLAQKASSLNDIYYNELIWREFYHAILWHFPQVAKQSFKPAYDRIEWRNNEKEFEAWCNGLTGYPIVDAGMRELNATGYMHNRVRMITASFLTKHLLVDWRWGEAYFAQKLLDFDLAANNGGWQWAAGTGCDAAPYFRIFNPKSQTEKFDAQAQYIRKWVPEFDSLAYPRPIVEHAFARERVLSTYKKALTV